MTDRISKDDAALNDADETTIPTPTRRKLLSMAGLFTLGVFTTTRPNIENSRQWLLKQSDPLARRYGRYTGYRLSTREYLGSVDATELDLRDIGYDRHNLAAIKYHPETERPDDGSWRRVDGDNPRWQWHVHLWDEESTVEVFSHYEFRPDPWPLTDESIADMHQRLRDHYNPKWDTSYDEDEANYFLGESCDNLREVISG